MTEMTLEVRNNPKLNVKRGFRLTLNTNFNLWIDYYCRTMNYDEMTQDLIDNFIPPSRVTDEVTQGIMKKRKGLCIIINHSKENYHKKSFRIKDARDILQKLKEYKRIETNVTHLSYIGAAVV